ETRLIDTQQQQWVYEAVTDTPGILAVRGKGTPEEGGRVCGNDRCEQGESWQTCRQDCVPPEIVVDANDTLTEAERKIDKGEPGYEFLQEARRAFQRGNYEEARSKAASALGTYRAQTQFIPPRLLLIGLLLLVGVGVAFIYHEMKEAVYDQEY
ncbi:MAG: hypothetical protein ABEI97_00540, partial [Candidatus Nanohaloarchaea archaeon]